MFLPYQYTAYIWPSLVSAAFLAVLGIGTWRYRKIPGATLFVFFLAVLTLWAVADALQIAAYEESTRIFWFQFQAALELPAVTLAFCSILDYAGFGKWLTLRNVLLLSIPCLVVAVLALSGDPANLLWSEDLPVAFVEETRASGGWLAVIYAGLLFLAETTILMALFLRSPRQQWPLALLIACQVVPAVAYLLDTSGNNPIPPLDPVILTGNIPAVAYAYALFRFRVFGAVPIAANAVVKHIKDGILVLNAEDRISDLNPAAERILHIARPRAMGYQATAILHDYPALLSLVLSPSSGASEVTLGTGAETGIYEVQLVPLLYPNGWQSGRLVLLRDVTESRRAQEQLVAQGKVTAAMEERERLARELHDSMGQILATIQFQIEMATELVARGQTEAAVASLSHLVEITMSSQSDIREYLLGAKTLLSAGQGLFTALARYVEQYSRNFGIAAELVVPPGMSDRDIDSQVALQLMRIIQEALSNTRKHARTRTARILFTINSESLAVKVEDDGIGFEPAQVMQAENQGFGLHAMRERAKGIGGTLQVFSAPGYGTQILFQMECAKARSDHQMIASGLLISTPAHLAPLTPA